MTADFIEKVLFEQRPEGVEGVNHLGEEHSRQGDKPVQRPVWEHTWRPVFGLEGAKERKGRTGSEWTETQVAFMLLLFPHCLVLMKMFLIYDTFS